MMSDFHILQFSKKLLWSCLIHDAHL